MANYMAKMHFTFGSPESRAIFGLGGYRMDFDKEQFEEFCRELKARLGGRSDIRVDATTLPGSVFVHYMPDGLVRYSDFSKHLPPAHMVELLELAAECIQIYSRSQNSLAAASA